MKSGPIRNLVANKQNPLTHTHQHLSAHSDGFVPGNSLASFVDFIVVVVKLESQRGEKGDRMADLPIANISRIMKNALPDNAKIAKDAKECVQECVTEFIAFITSEGTVSNEAVC